VAFVMLGALIEFARCTTNLWSYAAQIQRRTTKVILPYGLGALIVWLGALGVSYFKSDLKILAITLVISSVVTCAAMFMLMQRMLPVVLDVRRWLVGSVLLIIFLAIVVIMPVRNVGLYQNVVVLFLGGILTLGCMAVLLWRNPALSRLLSASLRSA